MLRTIRIFIALAAAAALLAAEAQACTRVVYRGPNATYLTARSMDFKDPIVSNLWVFPRGMKRHGAAGARSVEWTSTYGSMIVSGYEISTVDGMNEAGLNANLLWLANAGYPADDGATPRLSLSLWAQYFLDQFATVEAAVKHARAMPVQVVSGEVPGRPGSLAPLHLSLSDATGDNAIFEWIDGKLQVHHGREYRVLRARELLHRCGGPERRSPHGRRRRLQRDPQRLGALRHQPAGCAEPVHDTLAHRRGPQEQAVLCRIRDVAQRVLGRSRAPRLLAGSRSAHARSRRGHEPRPCR